MGKRKNKFEKLGVNENYVENNDTEKQSTDQAAADESNALSKSKQFVKDKIFPGVEQNKQHDLRKKRKFKYKKSRPEPKGISEHKYARKPGGIVTSHILMAVVMTILCVFALVSEKGLSLELSGWKKYAVMFLVSTVVYIIPIMVYGGVKKLTPSKLYVRMFSPSMVSLGFVSLLLMISLTSLEKYYIAYTFSYRITDSVPYNGSIAGTLFTSAVIPAVFETLFVNGALQSEYSRYGGGITGIFASSLVFAFMHLDAKLFIIYFTAGLVLGVLTHVSGSVFPAMLVHFANNAAAIFLSERMTFIASERIGGTFLMTVLGVFCFIFLLIQLQIIEKNTRSMYMKYASQKLDEAACDFDDERIHFLCRDGATLKRFIRLVFSPLMIAVGVVFVLLNM